MSAAHAVTTPTRRTRSKSPLAKIIGGALIVATLVAITIAVWPASEADKARDDGERLGEAVGQLYYADSQEEAEAALTEMHDAVVDTRDHAGDAVADQAASQEDALERAVDGYVGVLSADDEFEQDLYQAELDTAVSDLESNAANFQDNAPEVEEAFWAGFEDGLPEVE
jgi:hypothetical protein